MTPSTSRAIYWLQAFLALMVVAIHTGQDIPQSDPLALVVRFFDFSLTLPTLECYFLLAGYLMFIGFERFGWKEYRRVLSRRLITLVVPWILWCLIGYIVCLIFTPEREAPDFWNFYKIFWSRDSDHSFVIAPDVEIPLLGMPFGNGVMYFVRDVFIAALMSPAIWWFVRIFRLWTLPIVIGIFYMIFIPGIGPWHANPIFIPFGSALAVCHINITKLLRPGWFLVALWIILSFGITWMVVNFDPHHFYLGFWSRLYVLSTTLIGIWAYVILAFKCSKRRNSLIMTIVPFAFFIFAIHTLPIIEIPLMKASLFTNQFFQIPERFHAITELVFMFPVRIVLLIGLATLITRIFPGLMAILTGHRSLRRLNY